MGHNRRDIRGLIGSQVHFLPAKNKADLTGGWHISSRPALADLISDMHVYVCGDGVPNQEWSDEIVITADEMDEFRPFLERCRDDYVEAAGTDDYGEIMDRDYIAHETGREVLISFD